MTTVNPLPQVEHTASPHLSLSGTPLDPPAAIAHSLDSTLPPDSSQYSTSPFSQAPTAATHSQGNYSQIKLQRQLEYYFSRQNLVKDAFLVSQMDDDLYVPIAVIAKFKRVMEMTTSPQFLVDTLRQSSHVIVDPTGVKVKPNISMQRTTVILRDLPEATEQELTEFLQAIQAPPVQTMKQELGNMWYLTVATEDDALKMYSVVRGQSFKDHPVAARIKSESLVGDIQARKAVLRQQQQQQQQQHPFQQPFPQQQYHKPHHQQRQMYPPQRGNGNYMGYGRGQYHYQRQGQRNNYYTTNNYNQYVYHTQKQPAAFQRYRDPSLKQSQSNPTSSHVSPSCPCFRQHRLPSP
ncbi:La-domain-containing protein [Hesseltinella vesiculosa]|uniref:La-domain-containing protein n=1 Tax=Hesseltinella vesiculosa TaxID=101127 RepID=A0A1X2GYQ2_9FUNG|nr:La-domain-containing protein [Hesseltinella vesiculosa]